MWTVLPTRDLESEVLSANVVYDQVCKLHLLTIESLQSPMSCDGGMYGSGAATLVTPACQVNLSQVLESENRTIRS